MRQKHFSQDSQNTCKAKHLSITEKQCGIIRNIYVATYQMKQRIHQAETDQVFGFERVNTTFATNALSGK